MLDRNVKQVDIAGKFKGMSKHSFNNLLRRNDFKLSDVIEIAGLLDYDVKLQFVDNNSKKKIEVE